jgi:hypothetical protein
VLPGDGAAIVAAPSHIPVAFCINGVRRALEIDPRLVPSLSARDPNGLARENETAAVPPARSPDLEESHAE